MAYKLLSNGFIQRARDGAAIPADEENRDYQEYLDWLADGNEPQGPSLNEVKASRWTEAKAFRELATCGGCPTPKGRVDTSDGSQIKISGAVQMAMIAQAAAQPFSIDWTMEDNSVVPHDEAEMIALGVAVGQHVATCFATAVAIREAINSAESVEAVQAIDVAAGYPSNGGEF